MIDVLVFCSWATRRCCPAIQKRSLRTNASPTLDHQQQVIDVSLTVVVDVVLADPQCCVELFKVIGIAIAIVVHVDRTGWWALITIATFAEPAAAYRRVVVTTE